MEVFHIGQAYLNLQARATAKIGDSKTSSSFLKATTTTLRHTISEPEKSSYVAHINSFLGEDPFLKKYLPLDPATNVLFDLAKDGVLLWYFKVIFDNMEKIYTHDILTLWFLINLVISPSKLINVAVPGTIDERAINTKQVLNPWERNENHTLCLNSAKAIGCTVVNIGTQDLVEARVSKLVMFKYYYISHIYVTDGSVFDYFTAPSGPWVDFSNNQGMVLQLISFAIYQEDIKF